MAERKCVMCGKVFPEGTPASRKYCYECLEIRHAEQQRKQKEKRKAERKAAPPPPPPKKSTLTKANKQYCAKCIYCGSFSAGYLCNYILLTSQVRGCKAGVGCTRRVKQNEKTEKYSKRICERCGAVYVGTKQAHFCMACRREAMRKNVIKANEARRKGEKDVG